MRGVGLKLGKREDVTPAKREVVDRSGLTPTDWALMRVDNAFRDAHFTAVDVTACDDKMKRLDALLNDPHLAAEYPVNHPERAAAMMRHSELHFERKRLLSAFKRAAHSTAAGWDELPSDECRAWFRDGALSTWHDSPALSLALMDVKLNQLAFWVSLLRTWRQRPLEVVDLCPF